MKKFILFCVLLFSIFAGGCHQKQINYTISDISSFKEIEIKIQERNEKLDKQLKLLLDLQEYLGVRYKWGGKNKNGIDCSALIQNTYDLIGINLPRCSYQQAKIGILVDTSEIDVGDLVFLESNNHVNHVGIYIGANKIIHASRRGVTIDSITVFTKNRKRDLFGPKRILL